VSGLDLDAPCAQSENSDINVRWVLAHMIEEIARHAGHADIIRETLDGATGEEGIRPATRVGRQGRGLVSLR